MPDHSFSLPQQHPLEPLFSRNQDWARRRLQQDSRFFARLARQQDPRYLWIGCADSRVPANEIVGLDPGEVFVHRNVANLVVHSDMNSLSVLHFAINMLQVHHVMLVGHYGCSGVRAVIDGRDTGLANSWLSHVEDVADKHGGLLRQIEDPDGQADLLVELNVLEQAMNVCRSPVLRAAWKQGKRVHVHALVYGLADGILRPLRVSADGPRSAQDQYTECLSRIARDRACSRLAA